MTSGGRCQTRVRYGLQATEADAFARAPSCSRWSAPLIGPSVSFEVVWWTPIGMS
jgi:hypothetical protein